MTTPTTTTQAAGLKDVFFSYGRRQSLGFVARLHRLLKLAGHDCWFDKVNIPDGDDYQQRIAYGIASAHNFVFVMSPRSLVSPHCLVELEYARLLGKRIVPVNHVETGAATAGEISAANRAMLHDFYQRHQLAEPGVATCQQVRERVFSIIGHIDWLDAREAMTDKDCAELLAWAQTYENDWHRHEHLPFLQKVEIRRFGRAFVTLESVAERLATVLEREKSYVEDHTRLLLQAQEWAANQKQNNYLLVGQERKQAEDWLLQPFGGDRRPPCTPSALHCDYICQSRKNAENLMTDVFLCGSTKDQHIRRQVARSLSRYAVTSWDYERDIRKGEDYEAAIRRGIEEADNFIFFLSPETLASAWCQREYRYARELNKRVIPLLLAPASSALYSEEVFPGLKALQYVDFTNNVKKSDYDRDIDDLLHILKEENSYFEEHKKLLAKALKWKHQQERPVFLLRGFNLENARTWLRIHRNRARYGPLELHRQFIEASAAVKGSLPTEVFISYSRKDSDFARKLNNALQEAGKTTWFDQESIATGADFQAELYKGIESADNFLFIISPDAVRSPYCKDEVAFAAEQGKRCFSVLHRTAPAKEMPPELAGIQWLDFERGHFDPLLLELLQALDTDRDHARQHTVLQQRALEWQENGRHPDFLLNAAACKGAEMWLENGEDKTPSPTALQKTYTGASQQAIAAAEAAERATASNLKKRLQMARAALLAAVLLLLLAGYFYWQSEQSRYQAERNAIQAESLGVQAKKEAERASLALQNLSVKQQELERERKVAIMARDTAELRRVEAEQARLTVEQEREKLRQALRISRANQVFAMAQDMAGKAPTLAFNLMAWADKAFGGENELVRETLQETYRDHTFYKTYGGHSGQVHSVAFSPDGDYLLSGGQDHTAILQRVQGSARYTFRGHTGDVLSVAFSNDGKSVLTASADSTARLYHINGKLLQVLEGHGSMVTSVAFSPEGDRLLTGSADSTARLWNLQGDLLKILPSGYGMVLSVAFSPDGQHMLAGCQNGTAILQALQDGQPQAFQAHSGPLSAARFSPDGNYLLTASYNGTARLHNLQGDVLQTFNGQGQGVSSADFLAGGQRVLTGGSDGTARLWDLQGNQLAVFRGGGGTVNAVASSIEAPRVLTGHSDGTIKMWGLQGVEMMSLPGHQGLVWSATFSPDGNRLLTGSDDGTARLLDFQTGQQQTFRMDSAAVTVVAFSPDGNRLLTASDNGSVWLRDLQGNVLQRFKGHQGRIWTASIAPGGDRVLTAGNDGTARLWNLQGNELQRFGDPGTGAVFAAFSPDGRQVVAGKNSGAISVYNLQGKELGVFRTYNPGYLPVAFSPGGQHLLIGSSDRTAQLRSRTGTRQQTFRGHSEGIISVAFSPGGDRVLTASYGGEAMLWDLKGNLLHTFRPAGTQITTAAFSPDGTFVLTGNNDGTTRLWLPKMPLKDFLEKGQFDRLTEAQKKEYGLLAAE